MFKRRRPVQDSVETPPGLEPGMADRPQDEPASDRSTVGPFDVADVEGRQGRLDLGALWIPGVEGMELRLELEPDTQRVIGAMVVLGEAIAQLQAYAAPRSVGLWPEIRSELTTAIVSGGGTAQEQTGPWGGELSARMAGAAANGQVAFTPLRFIGIDGPRWFLRVVLSGTAATDEQEAERLLAVIRQTVVVRGPSPMAPREVLPLTLPEAAVSEPDSPAAAEPDTAPLDPFTRGPEITQIN